MTVYEAIWESVPINVQMIVQMTATVTTATHRFKFKYTCIQSIILYADCCYHIGSHVCESLYIFQPAL